MFNNNISKKINRAFYYPPMIGHVFSVIFKSIGTYQLNTEAYPLLYIFNSISVIDIKYVTMRVKCFKHSLYAVAI